MIRRILSWLGIGLLAVALVASMSFTRDMNRHYERIRGRSKVIPSPYGDIEYAEGGSGPAVLVVHGSGGGFDQGALLANALLGNEFRWIAPSRFGYLRSTFRPGATFDDQAHAYAYLLDHLGVKRAAVVTISHGGPSSLLFAVLHPDRVSSLSLISAGVASSDDAAQAGANRQGDALMTIYQHNWLYWSITKALRKPFMNLMGVSDAVIASLTPEQRTLADRVVDEMNPVSPRAAGAAFDNKAKMPNERIAAVRAPALIFHAKDDTLQLFRNAEYAAATIPGAKLTHYERGGHLLLAVELAAIRDAVREHIRAHQTELKSR